MNHLRHKIQHLLAQADITVGGECPWDIQVHNEEFYPRVLAGASLALGEAYMDGWWDVAKLDEFFFRLLRADLHTKVKARTWLVDALRAKLFNLQKPARAYKVGQFHYDLDNRLYQCMLGREMIYSCGYWESAHTLDEAQEAKLELVCRKLGLQPGMRVLDIGCGWGGAAKYAAKHYGVEVVGITVSEEQVKLATERCKGLAVEIRLQDYRDLRETFDRVFSIGMFEHVGYKNYRTFMQVVRACLKEDGLFLLHTIGGNRSVTGNDAWSTRYIFPNSMVPSVKQIGAAAEDLFVVEDWHNFGTDYDKTLMSWYQNFYDSWEFLEKDYNTRFFRMWSYYLLSAAGSFRARNIQLWQVVLSPRGLLGGYKTPRYSK
jgi:cyclopropane-fatty-acyl-phospholipid synthase